MHSHDRTMLANLGFADPDKKDPRHDQACQYIAELVVSGKLADLLLIPIVASLPICERRKEIRNEFVSANPKLEYMISKGEGKYKVTVGFIDVMVIISYNTYFDRGTSVMESRTYELSKGIINYKTNVFFEVKIQPISISDVVRQINLYRSYCGGYDWFLATAFQLPSIDVESLKREHIRHVFLGDSFVRWYEERSKIASRDTIEL